jgi:hypothetical protein
MKPEQKDKGDEMDDVDLNNMRIEIDFDAKLSKPNRNNGIYVEDDDSPKDMKS